MLSPERKYQIERAKDQTPSTSMFVWFLPAFVIFAWICRDTTYVPPVHHHSNLVILGLELL